jgi:hypothetical protein
MLHHFIPVMDRPSHVMFACSVLEPGLLAASLGTIGGWTNVVAGSHPATDSEVS